MKTKIFALVMALMLIMTTLTGCGFMSEIEDFASSVESNTEIILDQVVETTAPSNPSEFEKIFTDRNIVTADPVFLTEGVASFAMAEVDEGIEFVYRDDWGYNGDKVACWTEKIYVNVADWGDDGVKALEDEMKKSMKALDDLDCCTVSYEFLGDYYLVVAKYENVDTDEAIEELCSVDIIDDTSGYISISASEQDYIEDGYIKK